MNQKISEIIRRFGMQKLKAEGTYLTQTYQSGFALPGGQPAGTAIIGVYCDEPKSFSCFHRLSFDEVWHFYDGDPYELHLLHENGSSETVVMAAIGKMASGFSAWCLRVYGRVAVLFPAAFIRFTAPRWHRGLRRNSLKRATWVI